MKTRSTRRGRRARNLLRTHTQEEEIVCVFITAVPITKLFAWGGGGTIEDMCYERLRVEACVD